MRQASRPEPLSCKRAAELVMVAAELALLYAPGLPRRVGAIKFTGWYPDRVRSGPTV